MTTIGNRFGALLLNASGPTDQKVKNEKPKKKAEKCKGGSAQKAPASLKGDLPETETEKRAAGPLPAVAHSDHWHQGADEVNHAPVSDKRPRREAAVAVATSSGVQAKLGDTVTVTDCPRNTRQTRHERKAPPSDVNDEAAQKAHPSPAVNVPQVIVTVNPNPARLDDEFDDTEVADSLSKDDRSSNARKTYQKRLINAGGRVYDRRGPPEIRVKAVEKRGGRGAYNWGDQADQTGVPSGETGEDVKPEDAYIKGDKGVTPASAADFGAVMYTFTEYKEMLVNKKVSPVYRDSTGKAIPIDGTVITGSDHAEVMPDVAKPPAEHQRGHSDRLQERTSERRQSGLGTSDRSRGRGRMPDSTHPSRQQPGNGSGRVEGARKNQPKEVIRLDDMSDFPSL